MQERYLGDIHDYFKFLFLKFLSTQLNMKVGLNWYLVNPAEIGPSELKKKDGEKRNFLNDEELNLTTEKSGLSVHYITIEINK